MLHLVVVGLFKMMWFFTVTIFSTGESDSYIFLGKHENCNSFCWCGWYNILVAELTQNMLKGGI